MGDHPERLVELVEPGCGAAPVIANAIDDAPAEIRAEGVRRELDALSDLGLEAEELDRRDHFGSERIADDLPTYGLVWLRGGNVFLLRHALAASGADTAFVDLLRRDVLVYGGYKRRAPACSGRRCAASKTSTIKARSRPFTAPRRCGRA